MPIASPNLNSRVERFIQSIKRECLGKFIQFGRRHLGHIVEEWVEYSNSRRAHLVREHLPPVREKPEEVLQIDRDQVVVRNQHVQTALGINIEGKKEVLGM